MKNSVVFKFIAVFLCAASLLGAVGSGLAIGAMTELGLYQRSWDEVYQESLKGSASGLASDIAVRYAATTLGGCTTDMVDQYYGTYWYYRYFDWDKMGYTLADAEGNVLQEHTLEDAFYTFEFPVSGRYMKVLETMTQAEYKETYDPDPQPGTTVSNGTYTLFNNLPAGGAYVCAIELDYASGDALVLRLAEPLGYLTENVEGIIEFNSTMDFGGLGNDALQDVVVCVRFLNDELGILCEAYCYEGAIAEYSYDGHNTYIRLRSGTDPEQETIQSETVLYDAIPPEGTYVSQVYVIYADGFEESAGGAPDVGFLGYDDEGYVEFTTDAGVLTYREEPVTYIAFFDEAEELVYETSDLTCVGAFILDYDNMLLTYRAARQPQPEPVTGEVYAYDDIPPQGYGVSQIQLWLEGGSEMLTIEADVLGTADHDDEGYVQFQADNWKDFSFSKPAGVTYILMTDEEGRVVYEAYESGKAIGEGGTIGVFAYDAEGELVFSAAPENISLAFLQADYGIALAKEDTAETTPEETTAPEETEAPEETIPPTETEATIPEATVPELTIAPTVEMASDSAAVTEPIMAVIYSDETDTWFENYYDSQTGTSMVALCTYEQMPDYTVTIHLTAWPTADTYQWEWLLMRAVSERSTQLLPALGISLLLFAITAVYLCCAAGRKPGTPEVRAAGLNRLPLDLYLCAAGGGAVGCVTLGLAGLQYLAQQDVQTGLLFALLMAFAASLLVVGFCFACAAQFKTPGGFWWRNSFCGWCLRFGALCCRALWKFCVWMERKCGTWLVPRLVKCFKALWHLVVLCWRLLGSAASWLLRQFEKWGDRLCKSASRFFSLLPVTWQWLLVGIILVFFLFAFPLAPLYRVLLGICVILYGAHCFGVLLDAAKRMSKGDLDEKVDDKLLIGSFKEFAGELNGLADVAVVAAQKQLKSERMKTELITNVSHDIKTPLTSIINYVDLLQKPHTDEELEMYLEVLDRQSQRLKKLIDDLMEMSKASTGNLAVDIQKVDAAEAINQALGEFADKLDKAQLIPVFRQPEQPIEMMADGRLVWRVMSNLLGNAVKYALPGTRVYLDLSAVDGKVILSMKNISREELNVNADELLERFVRGDASRNTEGSGLGLNIAQSLMQLQKGQLQILVDGDLFKVTLIFPSI